MHSHKHTYAPHTHTHSHTYAHAHTHVHMHTHMHTHACTYVRTPVIVDDSYIESFYYDSDGVVCVCQVIYVYNPN